MFSTLSSQLETLSSDAAIGAAEMRQLRREFPGDGLREVVQMFVEEAGPMMERIGAALQRRDLSSLRRTGHALRGACANFGARPLAELCQNIETSARRGDLAGAAGLLERIREEYRRVEQALLEECNPTHSR